MALSEQTLTDAFNLFDIDRSGEIDREELTLCLQGLGYNNVSEIDEVFRKTDADASGKISRAEFIAVIQRAQAVQDTPQEILQAFCAFDGKGSGMLTLEDLRQTVESLGERVEADELNDVMRCCDLDMDGAITFRDWSKVMVSLRGMGDKAKGSYISQAQLNQQMAKIAAELTACEDEERNTRDDRKKAAAEANRKQRERLETRQITKEITQRLDEDYAKSQKKLEEKRKEEREAQEQKELLRARSRSSSDFVSPTPNNSLAF